MKTIMKYPLNDNCTLPTHVHLSFQLHAYINIHVYRYIFYSIQSNPLFLIKIITLQISRLCTGFGSKPSILCGMCQVCGKEVLLCIGGTAFKPSLKIELKINNNQIFTTCVLCNFLRSRVDGKNKLR